MDLVAKTAGQTKLQRGIELGLWGLGAILWLWLMVDYAQAQGILPQAETQFVDGNGAPYGAGQVCFYVPGTLTPKATYSDPGLATPNASPCLALDANGRALIWGAGSYRQRLFDVFGSLIWDQVTSGFNNTQFAGNAATTTGSAPSYILSATGIASYTQGLGLSWVASFTSTGGDTINVNSLGAKPLYKPSTSGPTPVASGDIRSTQLIFSEYDQNLAGASGGFALLGGIVFGGGTVTQVSDATNGGLAVANGTTTPALSLAPADLAIKTAPTVTPDLVVIGDNGASNTPKTASVGHILSGRPWQIKSTLTGTLATGSTQLPVDNTIPQITEGDQYIAVSITAINVSSLMHVTGQWQGALSNGVGGACAVFQDATANALATSVIVGAGSAGAAGIARFDFLTLAGTISPTTYQMRCGSSDGSATLTFNGSAGSGRFGGTYNSGLVVEEFLP